MKDLEDKLLIINKNSGPTSFDVVEAFRKATGIRKVGHTGTLDPLARGVLLLCTGKATRAVEHFMNLDKSYEFTIRMGVETTTLDAEGEIVRETPLPEIAESEIIDAAKGFVGHYQMSPPAYSALKQNGKRLYELARAGEKPVVESRSVVIHELEVTRIELPDVHLRIRCSRGTYVRSLARDFGEVFDLPAHLGRLVRTAIGPFEIHDAYPCERVFERDLTQLSGIKLSKALDFLPGIVVGDESKRALLNGALPRHDDVIETVGVVARSSVLRILDEAGELLAIGSRRVGQREGLPYVDSFRLFVDGRSILS